MLRETVARGVGLALLLALGLAAGCDRAEDGEARGTTPEAAVADSLEGTLPVALDSVPGADSEQLAVGRRAFVACTVCHGLDAQGTPLGPSLRDTTRLHVDGSPASIADVIRTGVASPVEHPVPMPPMGGGAFTPEEFKALVVYVSALAGA